MKKTLKLLSMVLVLTMALSLFHAGAEELPKDGQITITVGNTQSLFERSGIRLDIYLIATGNYGDWTMLDAFSDITVFVRGDGSASVSTTISQIWQRIREEGISATKSGETGSNGQVTYSNLTRGIYFVTMSSGPKGLSMSPILLSTPDRDGNIQIRVMATKIEYEPEPTPTNTPRPTMTPFVTPDVTPTPTRTPPPTPTATPWDEETPTPAPSETPTDDETPSPGPSETPTDDETPSPGPSESPTDDETPSPGPSESPTDDETPTPTPNTPTPEPENDDEPTPSPAPPTRPPQATPSPTPDPDKTPIPSHVPELSPEPGETPIILTDYETALGLGNVQMHVGVCFE